MQCLGEKMGELLGWRECVGVEPKIMGKTPQIIHLFIGFSIIFTIHSGGFPPIFGNIRVVLTLTEHFCFRMSWKPLLGAVVASILSTLGLLLDGLNYRYLGKHTGPENGPLAVLNG